jgi:hypothetical protein
MDQVIRLEQRTNTEVTYKSDFEQKVELMAGQPLRVIAFAFAEYPVDEWENQVREFPTASRCLTELI